MQDNRDASTRHDSLQQDGSLPFFTRFLEGQNEAERSAATTKYPSDLDDMMTMKYPSDGDDDPPTEEGIVPSGMQAAMSSATLKYPSDRDEWDPYLDF